MHLKPSEGKPRPVGQAIVNHLFKPEDTGRIPIVGITGTHGKTTIARLVARIIHLSGKHVGLACGDGLYFGQRQVEKGNRANWHAAHRVLLNRAVEAAVFENGSVSILSEGLAYDRCQVGVVANIDPADSLPEYYINNAEEMATKVKRTQVDVVLPDGVAVLNADDPLVADMASLCDGEVGSDSVRLAFLALFFGLLGAEQFDAGANQIGRNAKRPGSTDCRQHVFNLERHRAAYRQRNHCLIRV